MLDFNHGNKKQKKMFREAFKKNVNFFRKGGRINPKVQNFSIEFLTDWKELKFKN